MDDVNGNMGRESVKVNSETLNLKSVDIDADIDKQINENVQWKKRNVYQNYTNIEQRKTYMPDKTMLEIERAIQPLIEDRQKLCEISGTLQTIRYLYTKFRLIGRIEIFDLRLIGKIGKNNVFY